MEYRDRTTSLMKKKEEMTLLKNRGTIKRNLFEQENDEEFKDSKPEVFEEKKTLVRGGIQKRKNSEENDMDEREYSGLEDPSLMYSPQSMRSMVSLNERRHLDFNVKKMIELIENCCTNPLKQVEYMVELFKGVDFILNHEELWPDIFKCDVSSIASQSRLCKDMDYFLYNSLILIENQEQLRGSLLGIIASMAVINYPPLETFGFKCLKAVKELINNDNPLIKNLVIRTLKNVIIPLIKKNELMKISYNIINGVSLILANCFNKESSLFEPDLMVYAAIWIVEIKEIIEKIRELEDLQSYLKNYEVYCYHEVILKFVGELTMKPEFAESLCNNLKLQVLTSLFDLYYNWKYFKITTEEEKNKLKITIYERMDSVLKIIINISPHLSSSSSKDEIADFINESLEKKHIEILLKEFFLRSESYYSGTPTKTEETIEEFISYYDHLALLITTYAKLLQFKEINIFDFREEAIKKPCASQVLSLINFPKINPKILSACTKFLLCLLKHPNVEFPKDPNILNNISSMVLDYMQFFTFINGINYGMLVYMTSIYFDPIMEKSQNIDIDIMEFPSLRNFEIQECFFHITQLMRFISNSKYHSSKSTKTAVFASELCSQNLLFVKERNNTLFKLWEIPNDNLRLLVARTFSCINANIWKLDDIRRFSEMLKEMKTFTKKNIDELIAEFFLMFSKILLSYNHAMKLVFSEVIDLCFEILLNNMERNFRDLSEMNDRKIHISVSCIFFLRRASTIPDLQNYFVTPRVVFIIKKIFFLEEKYMKESMTPIFLEDTWACSNIEHLLQSTAGNEQIQANSLLGFRLISRIADILQGRVVVETEEDIDVLEKELNEDEERLEKDDENFYQWFNPKPSVYIRRISRYFERNLINKMKNELSTWKHVHKMAFFSNISKAAQNAKKEKTKHKVTDDEDELGFNGGQIVYRLAMFVLMKEKSFQNKAGELSHKTSLTKKTKDFLDSLEKESTLKEKPNIYDQMKIKNPLAYNPKHLRGKEILEIAFQSQKLAEERDLLFNFRRNFFDINNTLFLDYALENFVKIKSESPLKKRVLFEPIESLSPNESPQDKNSPTKSKKSFTLKPTMNLLESNTSVINKKGVEKLLESLNNNSFEDIISDIFSTQSKTSNRNTILLSALFRAMHFAYKNSKMSEKEITKNQLNSINVVRGLTKLAENIGWVNSNIGFKYLRAVKFYYTLPETCAFQDQQMLSMYEIIFKSLNRILKDIKNHCLDIHEKEMLKSEVLYLVNEVSHCGRVLLEQIRVIIWVKNQEEVVVSGHKKIRPQSSQEKCVEFVLSELLPIKNLKIIVKILLTYYKIFSDYSLMDQYESRVLNLKDKIIANFKALIACFLAICDQKKKEILHLFSEHEFLLNFSLRQSFLSEILKEYEKKILIIHLEKYFIRTKGFLTKGRERIQILTECLFRRKKDLTYTEVYLVVTNSAVYTIKIPQSSCYICPKFSFCQETPVIMTQTSFENIQNIITLEGKQRILIETKDDLHSLQFFYLMEKKRIEKIFADKPNIIFIKDNVYEEILATISISNKLLLWLYVGYQNSSKEIKKESVAFERRLLLITYSYEFYIIEENPQNFKLSSTKVIGHESSKKKISKKKLPKSLLQVEKKLPQNELMQVAFEGSEETLVLLVFTSIAIILKFDCDSFREEFKQELLTELPRAEWSMTVTDSGTTRFIRQKKKNNQ